MKRLLYFLPILCLLSCNKKAEYDAQGTFEATEIIVSAEATGKILNFNIAEGESIKADSTVGVIDSLQLHLQRKQLLFWKVQRSFLYVRYGYHELLL